MSGSPRKRAVRYVAAVIATFGTLLVPGRPAAAVPAAAPVSSSFDAPVLDGALWTEVDPVGDGTVTQSSGGLRLQVPGGTNHDVWTGGNRSLRVVQPVADVDLALEAKFTSRPSQRFQGEGILAEQDAGRFVRADWYHDGSTTRVFAATFVNGAPTTRANLAVSTTAGPLWLRVTRSGDTWTVEHSVNGSSWTTAASFPFALDVARVGPFALNAGSSPPSFTAVVDSFRNRRAPIVSKVAVTAQATSADVTWTTDRQASTTVEWGTATPSSSTAGTSGVTSHAVRLTGLTCATTYRYRIVTATGAGDAEWWGVATFTTASCGTSTTTSTTSTTTTSTSTTSTTTSTTTTTVPVSTAAGAPQPDEFSGNKLAAQWLVYDPVGDGTVAVDNGGLRLEIPGGTSHDTWTNTNRGLRVVQAIADGDFSVETKLDTPLTRALQSHGLMVEADDRALLRINVTHDGSQQRIFVGRIVDGTGIAITDVGIGTAVGPVWLRLERLGDRWRVWSSRDGSTFTAVTSFTHAMAAIHLGLFAGNAGNAAPALTSKVDWFRLRSLDGATRTVITGDDFSTGISSLWKFVNTDGSGKLAHSGTEAILTSAAGTKDAAVGNNAAPRLLQTIPDGDLRIGARFSRSVALGQAQGLLVEQSASRFIRLGIRGSIDGPHLHVALVDTSAGTTTTYVDRRIRGGPGLHMRLQRRADAWSLLYSYDGLHWSRGVSFVLPLNAARVGPFAATQSTSAAFSSPVDYVVDLSATDAVDDGVAINPPPSEPAIELFYGTDQVFGQRGIPQRWFNLLGRVRDPDGIASLTYSVDGGREQALWMGEDDSRLVEPGDFNADVAVAKLPAGNHTVRITATDWSGERATRTVSITNAGGGPWPRSYSITNWSSAPLASFAQVVDGRWAVQSNGMVRTTQTGYDRLLALGDMTTWTDLEVTAEVAIHDLLPRWGVGFVVGWPGHHSMRGTQLISDQPRDGHPIVAWFNYSQFRDGDFTNIYSNTPAKPYQPLVKTSAVKMAEGSTYFIKGRAKRISATTSRYQMKLWKKGTTEPTSWLLTVDNDYSPGSVLLAAHQADVSWGKVTVVPL